MPSGRIVELAGRGATFVREVPGPPGAPVMLLLQGLTATADLNWSACFDPLGRFFRVLAPDLRGHGRSPRSWARFTLEDCADDVAALADALGVDRMIAVGYSIGGLVAQLVWHRRPKLVAGLVLCATAADFRASPVERLVLMTMPPFGVAVRLMPPVFQGGSELVGAALFGPVPDDLTRQWMSAEMRRADLATAIEAGCAAASFTSRQWIGQVDVPTAVVISTLDRVVPPTRQVELAGAIPGATIHPVEGDPTVPVAYGSCGTMPRRTAYRTSSAWLCKGQLLHQAGPVGLHRPLADEQRCDGSSSPARRRLKHSIIASLASAGMTSTKGLSARSSSTE